MEGGREGGGRERERERERRTVGCGRGGGRVKGNRGEEVRDGESEKRRNIGKRNRERELRESSRWR
jgi:hypothetical protein